MWSLRVPRLAVSYSLLWDRVATRSGPFASRYAARSLLSREGSWRALADAHGNRESYSTVRLRPILSTGSHFCPTAALRALRALGDPVGPSHLAVPVGLDDALVIEATASRVPSQERP